MSASHPEQPFGRSGFRRDGQCLVWGREPTAGLRPLARPALMGLRFRMLDLPRLQAEAESEPKSCGHTSLVLLAKVAEASVAMV